MSTFVGEIVESEGWVYTDHLRLWELSWWSMPTRANPCNFSVWMDEPMKAMGFRIRNTQRTFIHLSQQSLWHPENGHFFIFSLFV